MASTKLNILIRGFSSSAVKNQKAKLPLQVFGIDGRYATALYTAGSKLNKLNEIENDLSKIQGTISKDRIFKDFLSDPSIKRQVKVAQLKSSSEKLALSPPAANLLGLLAENGRLNILNNIIGTFKLIMAAHRGEIPCTVTTAKPIDEALKKDLEQSLKLFLTKDQKLLLSTSVDPSIIGGMIVTIGDKYVDMSIASKIKKYTDIINTPI